MRTTLTTLTTLALILATAAGAHARGSVLKVDEGRAYIDLGTEAGVAVGSVVTLYHVISVKHPVSGKSVRDSFPLAKLRVLNSGAKISVVAVPGSIASRIVAGDEVELASDPQVVIDPWTQPRPSSRASVEGAANRARRLSQIKAAEKRLAIVSEVEAVWSATLGKPIEERIAMWKAYLDDRPESPYRSAVQQALSELESMTAEAAERARMSPEERRARAQIKKLSKLDPDFRGGRGFFLNPPTRTDEGVPVDLSFLVAFPDKVENAWLYYRSEGAHSYKRAQLTPSGDAYLKATVPGDAVRPPGVEYFVEVLEAGEKAPVAVLGANDSPETIAVTAKPGPEPRDERGRSEIKMFLDYVDFDGLGADRDNDQYVHSEIDFMYRFRKKGIHSLRLGFGTMRGTGGPKDVIDEDPQGCLDGNGVFRCRDVSYNYAYTELEWRLGPYVGLALRPQWGSAFNDPDSNDEADRDFFSAFGLRGRLRFGREEGSNLLLGAAATQRLGKLFEASFNWAALPEVPLVASIQVTDQPVIEDFGVRLMVDAGWKRYSWFYPSLRLAYQARDIDHAGPSAGFAANFNW